MPLVNTNKVEVMELFDPVTGAPIKKDDKSYLLLLVDSGSETYDEGQFMVLRGRRATFEFLISTLGNYDVIHSFILSGKIPFGKEVSIYSFMRLCITKHFPDSDVNVDELPVYVSDGDSDIDLDRLYSQEINGQV